VRQVNCGGRLVERSDYLARVHCPGCASVLDLVAKLAEADERIKREMAENEKLRALLAEWVSGATFHDDPISRATRMAFFQEMARRTVAYLNPEAKP
jgi:hypothetical protein